MRPEILRDNKMTFDTAVEVVLGHEGGYVDDKNDPGGRTKYGISKRAYPHLDIKSLTIEDAKRIYKRDYWVRAKVDLLPENLRLVYFDMVVNMGTKNAVKVLQSALNGRGYETTVDGKMGPQTLGNVKASKLSTDRVRAYRVKYYANLVTKKPKLERYYYGWYKRAIQT